MSGRTALVVATESWFVAGHFLVVIDALRDAGLDPVVASRIGRGADRLERAGARLVELDFHRGAGSPGRTVGTALALRAAMRRLDPALVHLIALKPIVLGGLVCRTLPARPRVLHLTGTGLSGSGRGTMGRARLGALMRGVAGLASAPSAFTLTENPDDLALLLRHGARIGDRHALLGGAGVDPAGFDVPDPPDDGPLRIGFVGRLVWSKGLDVLIAALDLLRADGVNAMLLVHGAPDPGNPRSVPAADIARWSARPDIEMHGHVDDIAAAWASCHLAAVPSRGGEGLPRALLEAAAAGRPAVVSDVPGCRHFVRDGEGGLVVPPEDPQALAAALAALARDPARRRRMGRAARLRLDDGFTRDAVRTELGCVYRRLLAEP